jgi:hypothetical protein
MPAMDPHAYCKDAIEQLRCKDSGRFSGADDHQMVVVLAYYVQHKPSERDFAPQLKLLIQSAERSSRPSLAAAAQAVLSDWETRTELSDSGSATA